MITLSVFIAVFSVAILIPVLRRVKFASERDSSDKSERLNWIDTLRSALLLGMSIGFIVWLLTGGFMALFSNDGVSCGRYEDMDSCVEQYELNIE